MMPSPLVSTIFPGPWLTALFRSVNVMTPSPLTSVRLPEHVRGDLGLVEPDVVVEVGMVVVEAGIDVGDDHAVRAGRDVPGRGGIDAPGAVQLPLVAVDVVRVVGHREDLQPSAPARRTRPPGWSRAPPGKLADRGVGPCTV